MMNFAAMGKIMKAREQFTANHPKFVAFWNTVLTKGIEEGTILEVTVTRPGEEPMTTNIKVQQSDLDMIESLKELANK